MPDLIVIALGGNAISPSGGTGTAAEQVRNLSAAMAHVADVVAAGTDVVLTHGNGPQVGAILLKNEMARDVVPAVPLDWCVAHTQATIGFVAATALAGHLAERDIDRPVVPLVARMEVAADDPAFTNPSKPVGPWFGHQEVAARVADDPDVVYAEVGERGWRRLVPSPTPLRSLDLAAVRLLLDDGAVVITNGGGGIPMVRDGDSLIGVEAVIDKDLSAALLARELAASGLVILTDVPGVAVDFGTPDQQWLEQVDADALRAHAADGQFAAGSMGPKVDAVLRFLDDGGKRGVIAALDDLPGAVAGTAGTQVAGATS